MAFLNGIALWGLAALAIPVAVHLLNRFPVRRMPWAAMRFLGEAVQRNERRILLEDLALLALRCLWVALLVLAFARPVLHGGGAGALLSGDSVCAILLVDDSLSMGQSDGVATREERARDAALAVLDGLAPGSEAALFLVADRVRKVVPEPTRDAILLRRALRELAPSDRGSDLAPGVRAALDALKGRTGKPREVYLFTDGQSVAWRHAAEIAAMLREAGGGIGFHLVSTGGAAAENLSLSGLRLDAGVPVAGRPLRCLVDVANWGSEAVENVRVTLAVDRGAPQAEGMIPRIDPGRTVTLGLSVRPGEAGVRLLTASIPPDRLPADNRRSLAVAVLDQVRALVVEGNAAPGVARVDRDGFFIAQALVPVPARERDGYYLKVDDGPDSLLRASGGLSRYETVFLAGASRLDAAAVTALGTFVRQGGGLVVLPGGKTDLRFYNDDPAFGPLLPAKLAAAQDAAQGADKFLALQGSGSGYVHPVTSLWNDADEGNLGSIRFTRLFPLAPASDARVVAAFADGRPAVVEHDVGKGRVVLFAAGATPAWGNLPLHPCFVPLVHRLVGYLSRRDEGNLVLAPGQVFERRTGIESAGREFSVLAPGEGEERRVAGRVEPSADGSEGLLRFAETEKAGPYQIFVGGETRPSVSFAVQTDPAESNLAPAPEGALADLAPFLDAKGKAGSGSTASDELWRPLLLAAFLLAVAECLLARYASRVR